MLFCMGTTIQLDDQLLSEAKHHAARTKRPAPRARVHLTFKGRGVQPGVDLDDTSSLLDLMERGGGSA